MYYTQSTTDIVQCPMPSAAHKETIPLALGCNKDVSTQTKEFPPICCCSVPYSFSCNIPCVHRSTPVLPKRTARVHRARGTLIAPVGRATAPQGEGIACGWTGRRLACSQLVSDSSASALREYSTGHKGKGSGAQRDGGCTNRGAAGELVIRRPQRRGTKGGHRVVSIGLARRLGWYNLRREGPGRTLGMHTGRGGAWAAQAEQKSPVQKCQNGAGLSFRGGGGKGNKGS